LKKQVKDLQAQIKGERGRANKDRDTCKKEKQRLRDEIKAKDAYCKQLQEKLEEADKKEEERKSALDQVEELSRQLQGAQEREQSLNRQLKLTTASKDQWYSNF
jgi:septal ring factor EnvC (AmiA/AmiB activator)